MKSFRIGRPRPALQLKGPAVKGPTLAARQVQRVYAASELSDSRDSASGFSDLIRIPATAMAAPLGSSGGGALMEKSKLSFKQSQRSRAPKLDDNGSGVPPGNKIFNGGDGGDGDDGDDDDYFNEDGDEDGDEGKWWHKVPLSQLYDAVSVRAVLSEWCMTIDTLPGFLQMLASMQYYSTAQWVRYLTMQERPNLFRAVERSLARFPDARSGFVGRMLADPAFMQKMGLEGSIAFVAAMAHECHVRGARLKDELDCALINATCLALGAAACSALVAPSKTPSPPSGTFPWQSMLSKLPNNAFEKNTPARNFAVPQRVSGFLAKGVELSAVNAIAGGASAALQHCALAARQARDPKYKPVTPVPGISRAAGGMGIYGGVFANTRLQVAAGLDQVLLEHAKVNTTWQVIGVSLLYRGVTALALENPWAMGPAVAASRSALQGAPSHHVPTPVKPRVMRKVKKLVKRKRVDADGAGVGFQMTAAAAAPQSAPAYA